VEVLEQELAVESPGIMRQCRHISVFLGEEPFSEVVQAIVSHENVPVWVATGADTLILVSALVADAVGMFGTCFIAGPSKVCSMAISWRVSKYKKMKTFRRFPAFLSCEIG